MLQVTDYASHSRDIFDDIERGHACFPWRYCQFCSLPRPDFATAFQNAGDHAEVTVLNAGEHDQSPVKILVREDDCGYSFGLLGTLRFAILCIERSV